MGSVKESLNASKPNKYEIARHINSLGKKKTRWCFLPGPIIESSEFRTLRQRAIVTLIGLHYFRSKDTNISRPGYKNLVKKFGKYPKYYQRGIDDLKERGLVFQIRLGGHNRASEYLLATHTDHIAAIKAMHNRTLADT